jgi:hypothetical protein
MKKLLAITVLLMGVLTLNAQRTPIKVSDLPKGVSDSINKEFPGYTIKESAKVVENNVTTYEVQISKGMSSKTLKFDNTGKSMKGEGAGHNDMDKTKEKSNSYPSSSSPSSSPSSTPGSKPSSTPSTTPSSSPSSPTTTPPNK